MKKIILISALILTGIDCFAQNTQREIDKRHELKINLPYTIFASFPEISYSYLLNEDVSVGSSLGISLNEDFSNYKFQFVPYIRWFFGGNRKSMRSPSSGLFLELNTSIGNQIVKEEQKYLPFDKEKTTFCLGIGISLGWKYVSNRNWVMEIFLGAGRNFVYEKEYSVTQYYPRSGIYIGKRF